MKIFRKIFVLLLVTIACLFFAEFVMRRLRPDLVTQNQIRSIPDAEIGWRFEPGQNYLRWNEEGRRIRVTINSLGFNDREHSATPDPSKFRICHLGDSFTAAVGVDADANFTVVSSNSLQEFFKKLPIENFNFGMPGFGTSSEYMTWQKFVRPVHPQIVVLDFYIGNDVANQLADYFSEPGAVRPHFEINNGQLKRVEKKVAPRLNAEQIQRNWFYRTFLTDSVLYKQYKTAMRNFRLKYKFKRHEKKAKEGENDVEFWKRSYAPVDWQTYLPEHSAEFEDAWKVTEALLLKLNEEVKAEGAELVVMLIPGFEAMDAPAFKEGINRYPEIKDLHWDVNYPRERLLKYSAQNGIKVCDLDPVYRKHSTSELYLNFDRHLNTNGHKVTGEYLAEYLKSNIRILSLH